MPTTGVAISAAAIAANAAHQAKVSECKVVISNFNNHINNGVTVESMQQYAHCVNVVYPQPMCGGMVIIFKVVFIIALLGLIGGGLYEKFRGCYSDIFDCVMNAILWFFLLPCVIGFIGGVIYGVYWLFT